MVEDATDVVVKSLGPMPEAKASKVEDELSGRIDWERFTVRIVQVNGAG